MVLSEELEATRPLESAASANTVLVWPSSQAQLLSRLGIPEPDGVVHRARREAAIGERGQRKYPVAMAFEPAQLCAGFGIPEPNG